MGLAQWWRRLQLLCGARPGFHDWIMFPHLFSGGMSAHQAQRTPLAAAEIEPVIESVFDHRQTVAFHRLVTLGPGLLPVVKRLLADPRSATVVWPRTMLSHSMDPQSPLQRICDLMQHACDDDCIRLLCGLFPLTSPRWEYAALALARQGGPLGLAEVSAALTGGDSHVISFTLMGITAAGEADRLAPAARDAWLPLVAALVPSHDRAPAALIAIDRTQAAARLSAADVFHADAPQLAAIITALNEEELVPEPARLRALIAELSQRLPVATGVTATDAERHRRSWRDRHCIAELLPALASRPDQDARACITAFTGNADADLRSAAFKALLILDGLPDAYAAARHLEETHGLDGLPEAVRGYLAALKLLWEVQNGGFAQYLVNGGADHWPDALLGLRRSGAVAAASVLQDVVDACGPGGPPQIQEARREWFARAFPGLKSRLDAADSSFAGDEVEAALAAYANRHRTDFLAGKTPGRD